MLFRSGVAEADGEVFSEAGGEVCWRLQRRTERCVIGFQRRVERCVMGGFRGGWGGVLGLLRLYARVS